MSDRIINTAALLLGLFLAANGAWMTLSPADWYARVPGVTETGPFNSHFVIDIGLLYGTLGVAWILGVFWRSGRPGLWLVSAVWLTCHALFHLAHVIPDGHPMLMLTRDFLGVTLPALLGILLATGASKEQTAEGQ